MGVSLKIFRKIDLGIRIASVVFIGLLMFQLLHMIYVLCAETRTTEALVKGGVLLVVGGIIFTVLAGMAIFPDKIEACMPGPKILWRILVRIPVYIIGAACGLLLLRQIFMFF